MALVHLAGRTSRAACRFSKEAVSSSMADTAAEITLTKEAEKALYSVLRERWTEAE